LAFWSEKKSWHPSLQKCESQKLVFKKKSLFKKMCRVSTWRLSIHKTLEYLQKLKWSDQLISYNTDLISSHATFDVLSFTNIKNTDCMIFKVIFMQVLLNEFWEVLQNVSNVIIWLILVCRVYASKISMYCLNIIYTGIKKIKCVFEHFK
jgi:hypothetical protein